jgi:TRAP-type C4-dicarboxylate transport system permease small subunit
VLNKILRGWDLAERYTVGVLALFSVFSAFYQVFMRYLFSYSPEWTEETVVYVIIWSVFIVASTLTKERGHVGATFLVEKLPSQGRRIVEIINALFAMTFCFLICWWGYQIVNVAYITDERSYLAVPAGTTLIFLRYLVMLYRLIFRFDDPSLIQDTHETSRTALEKQEKIDDVFQA